MSTILKIFVYIERRSLLLKDKCLIPSVNCVILIAETKQKKAQCCIFFLGEIYYRCVSTDDELLELAIKKINDINNEYTHYIHKSVFIID